MSRAIGEFTCLTVPADWGLSDGNAPETMDNRLMASTHFTSK